MWPRKYSLGALAAAAIGSFFFAAILFHTSVSSPVMAVHFPPSDSRPLSLSSIARKAMPVVVNISTAAQRPPRTWKWGTG